MNTASILFKNTDFLLTRHFKLLAGILITLLALMLFRLPPLFTSDSPSYLEPAFQFNKTGFLKLDTARMPLYPIWNWILSFLFQSPEQHLGRFTVDFSTIMYLFSVWLIVKTFRKYMGASFALFSVFIFMLDRWNMAWIRSVMEESPCLVMCNLWLISYIKAYFEPGRLKWIFSAAFVSAAAFLTREAILPIYMVTACFCLFEFPVYIKSTKHSVLRKTAGLAALLAIFALPLAWVVYNGRVNGYYGLSSRGISNLSARYIALANPEKINDWGSEPELFKSLVTHMNKLNAQIKPENSINSQGTVYAPFFKSEVPDFIENYYKKKGLDIPPSLYPMEQEMLFTAFLSNWQSNLVLTGKIVLEYMYLPISRDLWGEGKRVFNYIVRLVILLTLIILITRIPRHGFFRRDTLYVLLPVIFILLYWTVCANGCFYNPRFSTIFSIIPCLTGMFFLSRRLRACRASAVNLIGQASEFPAACLRVSERTDK